MTDDGEVDKMTNKKNEQELIESDIEQEDSVYTDDKSNVTTDDEFYNELMSAPAEYDDHLIPDGCKDDISGIEHLTTCLNRRYNSCPIVFTGTLKDALKESFNAKEVKERRPLLIYVNNDKSLYSNLFCKQLLCHEKIIEFLLNNYVLWAWDVTFESNGEMLNNMYKAAFLPSNSDQHIGTNPIDRYPLLIGIRRDRNGDNVFHRLIDGSNRRPVMDEFLGCLIQFKDQFDLGEDEFERTKVETKNQMMNHLSRSHDSNHQRSSHHNDRDFYRSTSMFSPRGSNRNFNPQNSQFARHLNGDNTNEFFSHNTMNLTSPLRELNINPDDGDDEDDDDQTPTVDRPIPKFPK